MSDRALNKSKEVAESLNNVSNAINEMATTYRGQDDLDAVEKTILVQTKIKKFL